MTKLIKSRGSPMMTMREMAKYVFAEPFRSFRINMDEGTTWHVQHPEMITVGKTKVRLWTWMSEVEEEASTQELVLLMNHITSIRFLD